MKSEKDVLGADEAVIEQTRLILGEREHLPRSVGEAFEHRTKGTVPAPVNAFGGLPAAGGLPYQEVQHGARGIPKPIMAMMSRWTSFVPPPKVKMVWLRAWFSSRPRRTAPGDPSTRYPT